MSKLCEILYKQNIIIWQRWNLNTTYPCRTIIISYVWIIFCKKTCVGCKLWFLQHSSAASRNSCQEYETQHTWQINKYRDPFIYDQRINNAINTTDLIVSLRKGDPWEQITGDSIEQWDIMGEKLGLINVLYGPQELDVTSFGKSERLKNCKSIDKLKKCAKKTKSIE